MPRSYLSSNNGIRQCEALLLPMLCACNCGYVQGYVLVLGDAMCRIFVGMCVDLCCLSVETNGWEWYVRANVGMCGAMCARMCECMCVAIASTQPSARDFAHTSTSKCAHSFAHASAHNSAHASQQNPAHTTRPALFRRVLGRSSSSSSSSSS